MGLAIELSVMGLAVAAGTIKVQLEKYRMTLPEPYEARHAR
jgi:hypothetical protein